MKNILTKLPEVAGNRSRSISTVMYDNSMENYIDSESARWSIPYRSNVIAKQIHFSNITHDKDYVIELLSGDVSICRIKKVEQPVIKLSKLNPEYPNSSIAIDQVKHVYEIYQVQQDRNNL